MSTIIEIEKADVSSNLQQKIKALAQWPRARALFEPKRNSTVQKYNTRPRQTFLAAKAQCQLQHSIDFRLKVKIIEPFNFRQTGWRRKQVGNGASRATKPLDYRVVIASLSSRPPCLFF